MNKPIFRVLKNSYYAGGVKDQEIYIIYMHSSNICDCAREDLKELRDQINLALNDQKVNVNEKGVTNE